MLRKMLLALGLALLLETAAPSAPAQAASPALRGEKWVFVRELPPEARQTLLLIRSGGPFRYPKDGTVFANRERLLPARQRGYYREYTVPTPGARNRGARRIIAGLRGELYYTDDHYQSFRRIRIEP